MAFKPYREAEVVNRTGTRQAAFRLSHPGPARSPGFSRSTIMGWMLLLGGWLLLTFCATAQATQPSAASPAVTVHHSAAGTTASSSTGKKISPEKVHLRRRHVRHNARRARRAKPVASVVAAPVAPPPPVPPAQQAAHPATIIFSHGDLRISADNSSLVQILTQISHQTGLDVEGLGHDQRIYGQYGPGPMGSTLAKLLDGSGYDYVLVGGGAGHSPTKLLLTTAGAAPPGAPAPVGNSTPVISEPENPSEPTQAKTPQQIFEELRRMHHHPPQ